MVGFAQCHDDIFKELQHFSTTTAHVPFAVNGGFKGLVEKHLNYLVDGVGLTAELCPLRLKSAHKQWLEDLKVAPARDLDGGSPDQYKHAGYLAFWLRRSTPIIRLDIPDSVSSSLSPADKYYVDFLHQFGNEHLAFMIGYEICLFFACYRSGMPLEPAAFSYDSNFAHDVCSTLKRKNMSPHALSLIYRALFMRRR